MIALHQGLWLAAVAVFLQSAVGAANYTLEESILDGGGGLASSEHYSSVGSAGFQFGAEPLGSASGNTLHTGFARSVNEPPHVPLATVQVRPGRPLAIRVEDLLANPFDLEGEEITFVSAEAFSHSGVPLRVVNGAVLYSGTRTSPAADYFAYTVRDASGQTARGLVFLSSGGPVLSVLQTSGAVWLKISGPSGEAYSVESSDSLAAANWSPAGTVTADQFGIALFKDPSGPGRYHFYRTVQR